MSEKAIIVENLWKGYQLGSGKSGNLRETLSNLFSSSKKEKDTFWALQDISFTINKGEAVGIIGRNGAGKSTLLKILSRITAPTKGGFELNGRVSSLLEVGTGFHPELTGRENIYLNGTILGMTRAEVKLKFDEIVAFAEVEKFLDTPVKRYSSGMYVRLAFAVAAHLEPEILIVDEVLAVGDAEFQKKCLGKMKDVSGEGRTVLFVSHNMAAIQNLCDKAIYLKNGQIQLIGELDKVISTYLKASSDSNSINLEDRKDRSGNGVIKFTSVVFKDVLGNIIHAFQCGSKGIIEIAFKQKNITEINNFHIAFAIDDEYGQRITQFSNEITNQLFQKVNSESNVIQIIINKIPFKQGRYTFVLYSTVNNELADWIQEAGSFDVESGDFYNTGKLLPEGQGNFYIEHSFQIK